MKTLKLLLSSTPLFALPVLLTGCAANFNGVPTGAGPAQGAALAGKVMGGQQPIGGARIYLFVEPSSTNNPNRTYGSPAVSLLSTSASGVSSDIDGNGYVLTKSDGTFGITGDYTCPTQNAQVYLLARGGDPGIGPGTNNEAEVMAAALGACSSLTASTFVNMNEITTVAAVTALQQFLAGPTKLATTPTNELGLQNAFLTAQMLVSVATGLPQTSTSNVVYPTAKIYTLANAVAGCVNSAGSTSATCAAFLNAATNPVSHVVPTNVFDALLNIAHYPAANPSGVYASIPATTAFGGSLSSAPADFSLALSYTGGGLLSARGIAVDGLGDVWVSNCGKSCSTQTQQADSIVVIQHNGLQGSGDVISGSGFGVGSVSGVKAIALDESNALWAVNSTPSITILQNSGSLFNTVLNSSGNTYFNQPLSVAIDPTGLGWVANAGGGNLVSLRPSGSFGTTLTNAQMKAPAGVAIDPNGNIVVADKGAASAGGTAIFYPNGSGGFIADYSTTGPAHPTAIAVDNGHNIWELDASALRLYKLFYDGTASSVPASGISLTANQVQGFTIDGLGEAVVPLCGGGCAGSITTPDSILFLDNTGNNVNGLSGVTDASLANPVGAAADPSGNLWVANAKTGAVTQFVGLAGPVLTPLSSAVFNGKVGVRP